MTIETLNLVKLSAYLEYHIEGFRGPVNADKFSGGQSNPTWLLNAASGRYVLRSKPPGRLLKSAHAVDREFRVIHALAKTNVPVARALHLCEEQAIIEQYGEFRRLSTIENWHFYLAFSLFRMSAICQGVYKRGLDGNASNKRALEMGKLVEPMAEAAVELIA